MKPTIYVAGPITIPDPIMNAREAFYIANDLWSMGWVPFVPQQSVFWNFLTPRTWEEWLKYDYEWVKRCDALYRIPGESRGADAEVVFAKSQGIPVVTSLGEAEQLCHTLKEAKENNSFQS